MKGLKTGGRKKGSLNKPKPVEVAPNPVDLARDEAARAMQIILPNTTVRTPKAVILDAMMHFEELAIGLINQAKAKLETDPEGATVLGMQGQKFLIAAVECATKAAPYVHARLLSVESRGDMTEDKAPFVIRAPSVMDDSSAWQAAVGASLLDLEAQGGRTEALAHPAQAQVPVKEALPAPLPVVLGPDPKTSRITAMPAGPRVVQPAGTQEWLDRVAQERKAAG